MGAMSEQDSSVPRQDVGGVPRERPRDSSPNVIVLAAHLRPRPRPPVPKSADAAESPALAHPSDDDDYRHRMAMNIVVFVFCVGLTASGLWLTSRIADMRRDQDCVLAGRPNCAHVSVTRQLP